MSDREAGDKDSATAIADVPEGSAMAAGVMVARSASRSMPTAIRISLSLAAMSGIKESIRAVGYWTTANGICCPYMDGGHKELSYGRKYRY